MPRHRMFQACRLPQPVETRLAAEYDLQIAPAPPTADSLCRDTAGSEVIVIAGAIPFDRALIKRLPASVKAIATYSVGTDHIDLEAARARGIAVFHTPDVLTDACAEIALFLLIGAARRATESIALIRSGDWTGPTPVQLLGTGITGKRLSILGMGRIGQTVADRARGFGMAIDYHNRSRLPAALERDAVWHADLAAFLGQARFLVVTCPATPETRGLLDAPHLRQLPRGAILVNIGRGAVVVDEALIAALRDGHLSAAGLDVFASEPKIHPGYYSLPNLFMLPHIASATTEAREAMGQLLLDGLRALWAGEWAKNRIA